VYGRQFDLDVSTNVLAVIASRFKVKPIKLLSGKLISFCRRNLITLFLNPRNPEIKNLKPQNVPKKVEKSFCRP
jgi:hypothetical protein